MKSFLEKFSSNLDEESKKKLKIFFIGFILIIVFIIVISIIVAIINRKTSYIDMESIMEKAAYKYYQANPSQLPNFDVKTSVVSEQTLVEQEYMKEISEYTKDESCSGNVVVTYKKDGDYDYQAFLQCNKFQTNLLVDKIKEDNAIVSNSDGLYDESGTLRFRGEYINNYLKINENIYRIIKIDENNNTLITIDNIKSGDKVLSMYWDNRYNTEIGSYCGINDFNLSRVKKSLSSIYDGLDDLLKKNTTNFITCLGKRSETDSNNGVECATVEEANISLIPVYEYMKASLAPACSTPKSKECANYNYLFNSNFAWWTLTGDATNTDRIYSINAKGEMVKEKGFNKRIARYVVALDNTTIYSTGNGSKEKPYEIR